jgi:hypothetical protein
MEPVAEYLARSATRQRGFDMKSKTLVLAMAVAVLASACSRQPAADNAAAPNASANQATPIANNAAPSEVAGTATGAIDRAFVTGRWGVAGDCSETMEFRADGSVAGPAEGARWSLEGNRLVVSDDEGNSDARTVARTGADEMSVTDAGETMRMTRCR